MMSREYVSQTGQGVDDEVGRTEHRRDRTVNNRFEPHLMEDIRTLLRQDPDQFENCAQFLKYVSAPAVHLDGNQ